MTCEITALWPKTSAGQTTSVKFGLLVKKINIVIDELSKQNLLRLKWQSSVGVTFSILIYLIKRQKAVFSAERFSSLILIQPVYQTADGCAE